MTNGGEWSLFLERINVDEYTKRADTFTGNRFCPGWDSLSKAVLMLD